MLRWLGAGLEHVDRASPLGEEVRQLGADEVAVDDHDAAADGHPEPGKGPDPAHVPGEAEEAPRTEGQSRQGSGAACTEVTVAGE